MISWYIHKGSTFCYTIQRNSCIQSKYFSSCQEPCSLDSVWRWVTGWHSSMTVMTSPTPKVAVCELSGHRFSPICMPPRPCSLCPYPCSLSIWLLITCGLACFLVNDLSSVPTDDMFAFRDMLSNCRFISLWWRSGKVSDRSFPRFFLMF